MVDHCEQKPGDILKRVGERTSWGRKFSNGFAGLQRVQRDEPPNWIVPELQLVHRKEPANG